ncbi:MAG: PAS domain S-box protein [Ignavibacteriales bacterium]|nr:PAS domain S-box protein [Ignavibacteriales bacterium]
MKPRARKQVTPRKEAKQARHTSHTTYRGFLESAGDAIFLLSGGTGKIVDVNKAALRMFGLRSKKAILDGQIDGLNAGGTPFTIKELHRRMRLASSGKPQRFEWLVKKPNGTKFWVEASLCATEVEGEKRILALVHDIDERKQTEQTLRESRDRYRNLINLAVDGVLVGSSEGIIIEANSCMCAMTGRSRKELLGKHISKAFFAPESLKHTPLRFDLLEKGEMVVSERTIVRPDGTEIPVEMRSKKMPNGTYQSIYRNITERKRAEETLQESESEFRQLWGATVEGIVIHDGGVILEVNNAMCQMFGIAREQVLGKSLFAFAPPESRDGIRAHVASESGERFETPALRADGTPFTVEAFPSQIYYHGKMVRMVACRDITARKQSELSLAKLKQAIDTSGEAIFITDREGVFTYVNPGFSDLYGYTGDEVIGKETPRILKSGLLNEKTYEQFWKTISSGQEVRGELLNKHKDGRVIEIDGSATPIVDENKRIIGYLGIQRNITERKNVERALRESETRLRTIIDAEPECVKVLSLDGKVLEMNQAGLAMLEAESLEELRRQSLAEYVVPSCRDNFLKYFRDTLRGPTSRTLEFEVVGLRGTHRWLETSAVPLLDDQQRTAAVLGITRDITERKRADEALRENEEKFRIAFDNAPTGMSIIHPDGTYVEVNPCLCQMFGYTREELLSGTINRITHPDDVERGNQWIQKMIAGDLSEPEFEKRYIHKDGHIVWGLVRARWTIKADGTVLMSIAHILDITERKKAEEALRDSESRYRSLIEGIADIVLVTDLSGTFLFCNPAFELQTGYASQDFHTQEITQSLYHPDDVDKIRTIMGDFIRAQDTSTDIFEYRLRHKTGSLSWQSAIANRIVYQGKPAIQIISRNISERKRAQEALRDNEERMRSIIDHAPFGAHSYTLQADGQLILDGVNNSANRMLNFDHSAVLGKRIEDAFPGLSETVVPETYRRVAASGESYSTDQIAYHEGTIHGAFEIHAFQTAPNRMTVFFRDITERKKAEEALRESENRMKSIFRAAPVGIGSVTNRVLSEANAKLCEITGYQREELLGRSSRILYPTEKDFEFVGTEKYRQIAETGTGTVETRWKRKDGSVIDVLLSSTPIDPSDLSHGVTFTALDITERKRSEEALKRYQLLSQNTRDIILFVRASDGQILEANDAAVQAYGYGREDLMMKSIRDLRAQESTAELAKQIDEANRAGLSFETLHRRRDGTTFPVEVNARGMTMGEDRILMSIVRDITERKQADEALRKSEAQYRDLIETMPDGVYRSSHDGKFLEVNPAMVKILGYDSKEELLAIDIKSQLYFDEEDRDSAALEEKNEEMAVFRLRKKDGSEVWVEDHGRHVVDEAGTILYHEGILRDITERKRMEGDRARIENQIQQTQKLESLGLLAGGIAHDFNNLLSGIFGYIELAKKSADAGQIQIASERLSKAMNVFGRARDLSRQLITFAKGGAPAKTAGEIGRTVSETVQFALSGSNVKCDYSIADDLWPCMYDPNQVGQVIDNIVINAKHAMPNGGSLAVSASNVLIDAGSGIALPNGSYIRISIKDHGIGIPKEYLQKIFDPFFTTKHTGSGLGLATCWSIVKRHEGTIVVESEPGKGSTFHVFFPAEHGAVSAGSTVSVTDFVGHGRVLVMDDEEHIREILEEMLTDLGYAVQTARDGAEAIEYFSRASTEGNPFDMVLVDLTIPGGMGGKETLTRLVELKQNVCVIASSGYSEDPVISAPRDFGFAASIRKPYRKTDLIEAIVNALATRTE